MSLLDRLRRQEPQSLPAPGDQLHPGYRPRFTTECQSIWTELVPERGTCSVLQGEMLRAVQALADEAQQHGNINWDRDFERFCDLLHTHLHDGALPADEWAAVCRDLDVLRRYGRVAYALKPAWARDADYPDPAVPEPLADDLEQGVPAYVHADLYDHLADCVAQVARAHPRPLHYAAPADQLR